MAQQLIFIALLGLIGWIAYRSYARVWRNMHLGKKIQFPREGKVSERWKNVLLVAFGQKKMFKNWTVAILHLFLYVAFLITQVELIEIIVDGVSGSHRFFASSLKGFYTFVINSIELLSVLAFVATVAFLARRNLLKVPRLNMAELKGWPMRDANLILLGEIVLLIGIFSMNGADMVLQARGVEHYPQTQPFLVSSKLGPALFGGMSDGGLIAVERFGWWLHIIAVFGFLIYLPHSKHLHILLAFPSTWYARLYPKGKIDNMPEVQKEVRIMMGLEEADPNAPADLPEFGANDVFGLLQINLLHAYACTECGRCTSVCPANLTGKKLSPRKIMMDVRDRCEEVGRNLDSGKYTRENYDDGKSLFDYISPEELHACTTCNACVEACPVLINPLDIIMRLRRHEILTQSAGPADWLPMFNAIENAGAAWQMSESREQWMEALNQK
ncbi:MAG: 4Fe-4S dicluster domain-containing protein [Saprospiraceae bacterium]